MMKYVLRDLFDSENQNHLAHCVSADFKMGAGIAKIFRKKYGHYIFKALENPEKSRGIGKCIVAKTKDRYIFNLITKPKYYHKPTLESVEKALIDMFEEIKKLNLKTVSMPKIGCGLDKLKWKDVKKIIEKYQGDVEVEVYIL